MLVFSRGTSWSIGVIATLVLLASISSSESVKVRKLRRRPMTGTHQQQFRIAPVLIKVINKHPDKDKNGGASSSCTDDACRNALEKLDVNKLQDNYLLGEESMRYIVYPKKYEHFVSKKNTGSHRYKRDFLESQTLPEADDKNTDKTLKKTRSKIKFWKNRLGYFYNTNKYTEIKRPSKSSGELGRTKRSIDGDDYPSRARNASDYYAQRRAVMERFYARQREINARYATNRTDSKTDNASPRHQPVFTSNATLFGHLDKDAARKNTTFRPSVKIDPIYNSRESRNKIPTGEPDNRRNPAPETGLGFKSDPSLSQARSSGNVERNALDYYVTPTPCPNASLSGTFAPKTRPKHAHGTDNCTDHVTWGKCEGQIAYQHNLLLGITGPSTVDAVFEVILEGPLCITCVEAIEFNDTRARVTLHSGGRGKGYVKLWLQGYENEGFSYIIKIWAVQKTDESCSNVD